MFEGWNKLIRKMFYYWLFEKWLLFGLVKVILYVSECIIYDIVILMYCFNKGFVFEICSIF